MGVLRGHPLACPPSWGGICTRLVDSLPCHKHTLGLGVKTDCCDDQVIWKQEDENAKVTLQGLQGVEVGQEVVTQEDL